jgi:hypothetical protein
LDRAIGYRLPGYIIVNCQISILSMDGYRNIDTDVCRMQIKIGNIFIERILKKRRDIFLGLRQGI